LSCGHDEAIPKSAEKRIARKRKAAQGWRMVKVPFQNIKPN
jgi:hypothetical protein